MSTLLVTGGAGYVGSHTVLAVLSAGYDVAVYDDLSAGHAETIDILAKRFPGRSVRLIRGDIGNGAAVLAALRETAASAVLHFAARLLVGESVRDPVAYYRTNVIGTLTVLGAMADAGVKRFVFSSTAATFGEPMTTPLDETHPQRPINPYGETKLTIERALPHLERALGLRSVVLRYFNAAGADPEGLIGEDHDPEEHLIPRALAAARGGEPLIVFGEDYPTEDGTCVRDFVHVSDLADAHVAALRSLEASGPSAAYNLGNGKGASVRDLLTTVERVTGRKVPYRVGPRRPGDPARLVASSERIQRELGWRPRLASLDTIVETAWRWHSRHPDGFGRRSSEEV
jgi:UDP-glucose-4-epimerase GalE